MQGYYHCRQSCFAPFGLKASNRLKVSNRLRAPYGLKAYHWLKALKVLLAHSAALLILFAHNVLAQLEFVEQAGIDNSDLLSDDNLLIVDIYLEKYRLARDVFVYANADLTLVPLQPLFDAIEFPILVDAGAKTASGWFLKESTVFELNVDNSQLNIDGNQLELPDKAAIRSDDYDLYANMQTLNDWFPLTMTLDKGRLRLNIVSTKQLPLEKQLQRERARKLQQLTDDKANGKIIADHYKFIGYPVIDVQFGSEFSEGLNADGVTKSGRSDFSRSLFLSADVLNFQGSFSSSKLSRNSNSEHRLTFLKRPNLPNDQLVGRMAYAALGDVFGASDALVFSGDQGRGLDIEFGMAQRSSDFGKRVIEGEVEPGWEVEVYKNGVFFGFQLTGSDGRYHFNDVPIDYGENNFELRLYGPLGQEQVRRESINVGDQALPKGETYMRVSYVDVDRMLFGNSYPDGLESTGAVSLTPVTLPSEAPTEQKLQLNIQKGLSDSLSASLALSNHMNSSPQREDNRYVQTGVSLSLSRAVIDAQYARQLGGGYASLISSQTQIGNVAVSILQKRYAAFESDRNENRRMKRVSEMRLSGSAQLLTDKKFAYSVTLNEALSRLGTSSISVQSNIGFRFFSGRMNLETSFLQKSESTNRALGSASYIRNIGAKTSLRFNLNYGLKPSLEPTSVSTSILWRAKEKFYSQLVFSSDFGEQGSNNLGVAMNYRFPKVTVSSSMLFSNSGKPSIQLSADFSLAKEHRGRWAVSGNPMAGEGRLRARVFLDHDYDGEFSNNDEPLSGVGFLGRHDWKQKSTNDEGLVYLSGLRTQAQSNVALNKKSLADPYWRSEFVAARLVSHAGGLQRLDIPIQVTVEAEGSLYLQLEHAQKPLAGIPLEIKNAKGLVVATLLTEFDGYFLAEGLIPGAYTMEINSKALAKFGIGASEPVPFEISSSQGVHQFPPIVLASKSVSVN